MTQCPNCRTMIPYDSAFCDQCGIELMWCPDCKRPKPNRGRECPVCGSDLVSGRKYLNGNPIQPQSVTQNNSTSTTNGFVSSQQQFTPPPQQTQPTPQGTVTFKNTEPTKMVGNGWTLPLREGQFGRTTGVYPEFASCKYVSGNHGKFTRCGSNWMVTDNGSTNGTSINGVELTPGVSAPLHIGDKLIIATLEFDIL